MLFRGKVAVEWCLIMEILPHHGKILALRMKNKEKSDICTLSNY